MRQAYFILRKSRGEVYFLLSSKNLEVKFTFYYPLSPQELFRLFKSGRLRSQRAKLYDEEVALN